jgi:hypothetical protein
MRPGSAPDALHARFTGLLPSPNYAVCLDFPFWRLLFVFSQAFYGRFGSSKIRDKKKTAQADFTMGMEFPLDNSG